MLDEQDASADDVAAPAAMSCRIGASLYPHRSSTPRENDMSATYTFDVFSSLDGYGAAERQLDRLLG